MRKQTQERTFRIEKGSYLKDFLIITHCYRSIFKRLAGG